MVIDERRKEAAKDCIRTVLYPESQYPPERFPDLVTVVLESYVNDLTKNSHFRMDKADGREEIEKSVLDACHLERLLKEDPYTVVMMHRSLIEKFVSLRHLAYEEWEDIIQEIFIRLLSDKIYKIQKQYDFEYEGRSSFTSYFMVTVRNIYMDMVKSPNSRSQSVDLGKDISEIKFAIMQLDFTDIIVLRAEIKKLQAILALYHKIRPKLELVLKLKFRIDVNDTNIKSSFPNYDRNALEVLTRDYRLEKDGDVWEQVQVVFNRLEKTEYKSDSLRRWVNVKVKEVINLMNRTLNRSAYDESVLETLLNLYYQSESS